MRTFLVMTLELCTVIEYIFYLSDNNSLLSSHKYFKDMVFSKITGKNQVFNSNPLI